MKLSFVIPFYNEVGNIEELLERIDKVIKAEKYQAEIICVDDGSTDGTSDLLDKMAKKYPAVKTIHHEQNQGLGVTLRTGFKAISGDLMLTFDGDLSQEPELIPELVKASQHADFIVASRYVPGGGMVGVPQYRILVSEVANGLVSFIFGIPIKDKTSGYRAIKVEKLKKMRLESDQFEIQIEEIAEAKRVGCTFAEVPLMLKTRKTGTSKFRFFEHSFKFALNLVKFRLRR